MFVISVIEFVFTVIFGIVLMGMGGFLSYLTYGRVGKVTIEGILLILIGVILEVIAYNNSPFILSLVP